MHRGDLALRDLEHVDARYTFSSPVNLKHELGRLRGSLVEELLEQCHDELHRRVAVVEQDDLETGGSLDLSFLLGGEAALTLDVLPGNRSPRLPWLVWHPTKDTDE